MKQYMKFVKPSYENFVEPSKRFADVIIPNTKEAEMENNNAVHMIVQHIKHQLERRNAARKITRGIAGYKAGGYAHRAMGPAGGAHSIAHPNMLGLGERVPIINGNSPGVIATSSAFD